VFVCSNLVRIFFIKFVSNQWLKSCLGGVRGFDPIFHLKGLATILLTIYIEQAIHFSNTLPVKLSFYFSKSLLPKFTNVFLPLERYCELYNLVAVNV